VENGFKHGGYNKGAIEITYTPYIHVLEFLECERRDAQTLIEWNKHKNLPP